MVSPHCNVLSIWCLDKMVRSIFFITYVDGSFTTNQLPVIQSIANCQFHLTLSICTRHTQQSHPINCVDSGSFQDEGRNSRALCQMKFVCIVTAMWTAIQCSRRTYWKDDTVSVSMSNSLVILYSYYMMCLIIQATQSSFVESFTVEWKHGCRIEF